MSSIITLLTDFGEVYTATMKGKILETNPDANIVDISHGISQFNMREGAFLLSSVVPHFPSSTVHIAVVDPGVGTKRRPIIVESDNGILVGPDNGLLIPSAKRLGDFQVYEVTKFPSEDVSATFHGRDVFAPIGAKLSLGEPAIVFGNPIDDFEQLDLENFQVQGDIISCEVIYLDDFGNLVTNVPYKRVENVLSYGDGVALFGKLMTFSHSYGEVGIHQPLAVVGSHETLEIAVNQGNASQFFDVKSGANIQLKILKR